MITAAEMRAISADKSGDSSESVQHFAELYCAYMLHFCEENARIGKGELELSLFWLWSGECWAGSETVPSWINFDNAHPAIIKRLLGLGYVVSELTKPPDIILVKWGE
jgi:hypothetical protein